MLVTTDSVQHNNDIAHSLCARRVLSVRVRHDPLRSIRPGVHEGHERKPHGEHEGYSLGIAKAMYPPLKLFSGSPFTETTTYCLLATE